MRESLADLKAGGYDGCVSIEPHMGAVIHTGERSTSDEKLKATYIEYGRRLMRMVKELPV